MKRNYVKPNFIIEQLSIDLPAARGCDYKSADYADLMDIGYFASDMQCSIPEDEIEWGDNTICLNTNTIIALTS